jgi:ubiquinone/menaquinone biosynthesis C-methylase UbiE
MSKIPTASRFDHVSGTYDKYRIQYSLNVVKKICGHVKNSSKKVVVDIGSGTGILTRQLAVCKFKQVIAVEPNDLMREISTDKSKNILHLDATSINMKEIKTSSVDIITVGTAIHWFEPRKTYKEFKRILKKKRLHCHPECNI